MAKKKDDERKYTKDEILESKKYLHQQDLVNAILKIDEKYTFTEVDSMIKVFLEGVIK